MNNQLVQFAYLASAVLFIVGMRNLSSPKTAPRGNLIASFGMLVAVLATLAMSEVVSYWTILAGVIVGSGIGTVLAVRIQMTAMPQMVALLNGFGGGASALVATAELLSYVRRGVEPVGVVPIAIVLGLLIGALTFTGSLIAFAKLQELMKGAPMVYPGQQVVNAVLVLAAVALGYLVVTQPFELMPYYGLALLSLVLGVLFVIPIGGADMPVVISLLNSYSGLAACATGFVLGNAGLVISGSLVGASGIILTKIMCDAMNRSLANVLFSGFGAVDQTAVAGAVETRTAKGYTPDDAAVIFMNARSCIVVPGYGMAVAQAQHAVRELSDLLQSKGISVKFAIHPVAGRMPGHMNVLLAEADVPYEQLIEMDEINPEFPETDVALVIGANDVVNPDARTDKGSPIYGMPILDVDRAQHVFVIKRSMNPGFAGVQNPLFFNDNTMMVFGDAKGTVLKIAEAIKNLS
ncbi:MAG: NAD(P)(+) transhydrogenase (Re/Si-specific) subunit beta [Myxococcales bacterium]|nr:NAD(P)(+) transhydrogenase (Re/Si-specific) subunit beta [Myxococcales bacterium]MDH5567371.1 NAD(P)(+) transhydrogenase (Re/Si-specific) subunit beta [Myxococcales bacterium]